MKIRRLVLIVTVILFSLAVQAAPLEKYSAPSAPAKSQRSVSPEMVKQRLNQKMQEAIRRLNAMPADERKKWIHYYTLKMKAAQKKGDYLESGYYSGILAGVGVE